MSPPCSASPSAVSRRICTGPWPACATSSEMHGGNRLPSDDDLTPSAPRDPAAFRAAVLRRAARIERHRQLTRAGGWALGIVAVVLSALALIRVAPRAHPPAASA